MTAPKIDTQAPERVWLDAGTFNGAVGFAHSKQHHPGEWKPYVAEDLSAAREAAAVERAFRDGLAYATNVRVKDHDQAWQQSLARERLGDTAALDRLIAERVREAVEAEREACRQIVQSVINDPRTKFWGDLAEARARIVARGSKEGRDA